MIKDYGAYKTIGEVAKILTNNSKDGKSIHTHTIRYWEKEFKQIKPKLINKRRYYSSDQVKIIKFIKTLLKDNGLTIKGVKRILNSNKKLDYNDLHGLSAEYFENNIKNKSKIILDRIKKLKKLYGKKNTY